MRNLWVLSLLVCVFCVAVVFSVKPTEDDDDVAEENDWKAFKAQHKRKFSPGEEGKRRGHFKKNRKSILAHNKKFSEGKSKYKVKINKFADWTDEEFKQVTGFIMPTEGRNESLTERSKRQTTTVPASKDWRTANVLNPVQNQQSCGSCYAFSATGTLEAHYAIKYGWLNKLSEQYAVDCTICPGYGGCKGAWMNQVYDVLIKNNHGMPMLSAYPYKAVQAECPVISSMATYGKITKYVFVAKGDEEDLKRVVGTIGPVSFAMNIQEIGFRYYESGVFDGTECSTSNLNHAMVIVGYGTDANGIDYWIIRNSWGAGWGEGGYTKVIRNQGNRCGVASYALYPVIA